MNYTTSFYSFTITSISFILFSGCCSVSDLTTFKDPGFPKEPYHSLVIVASFSNLEWRQKLETAITDSLIARQLTAVMSYSLASPTQDWTVSELDSLFKTNGAEGYLLLSELSATLVTSYNPGSTFININRGSQTATATTNQGSIQQSVKRTLQVELFDLRTGQRTWIGTLVTKDLVDCHTKIASKIVTSMRSDKVIP